MGEKSHRNVTFQESFVCLFLKRPEENQKWRLPSLSVPMKILPTSLTSKVGTLRMHSRREWVNQDHRVEMLVNKNWFKFRVGQ